MITIEHLRFIMPFAKFKNLQTFHSVLVKYAVFAELNTVNRLASYISQIAHETLELLYLEEIASGKAYEGRKDLGNVLIGDGPRFKGRGYIHLTGRKNYKEFTRWLLKNEKGIWLIPPTEIPDFERRPELLLLPEWAMLASIYYWEARKINRVADDMNIKQVSKLVNGGYNGLEHRIEYFNKAIIILSQSDEKTP